MADPTSTGWFPFVTLLVGYAAKSIENWVQNRWTLAKEREARIEARRDQRSANRIGFQRDTLLHLQDAVQRLSRATGQTHHLDQMAYRKNKAWHKELLPDELDQEYLVAQTQTSLLSSRVRDDKVRELVRSLRDASTETVFSATESDSSKSLQRMMAVNDALHGRIGN